MKTPNKKLLDRAKKHYFNLLGLKLNTRLSFLESDEFAKLSKVYAIDSKAKGIFLPRSLDAVVNLDSENLLLDTFHEYFGHGLFYEYSRRGKFLRSLDERLIGEEIRQFKNTRINLGAVRDFRASSRTHDLLLREMKLFEPINELFAVWTELYLSKFFDLQDKFEDKYPSIAPGFKKDLDKIEEYRANYGDRATFYELGIARYPDADRVRLLLKDIFGDKTSSIKLAISYGSKRAFSDIDILLVSDNMPNFNNRWLDIYALSEERFNEMISLFDISVTDPIVNGEFLMGDKTYLNRVKAKLKKQKITPEAIRYNLARYQEQKVLTESRDPNSKEYFVGRSYVNSFLRNAIQLSQGKVQLKRD